MSGIENPDCFHAKNLKAAHLKQPLGHQQAHSTPFELKPIFFMDIHKRRKFLQAVILIFSLAAILLLAVGLPNLRLKPGNDFNLYDWLLSQLATVEPLEFDGLEYVPETKGSNFWSSLNKGMRTSIIITFWVILVFSIVYAFVSPQFRRELVRMLVFILTLTLILPTIAENLAEQFSPPDGEGQPGQMSLGEAGFPEPPPFVQQPPGWFLIMIELMLVMVFVGGVYLIWRHLRPKPDPQAVVVRNVRQALSDLESESNVKDVVLACYSKMCREMRKSQNIFRHHAMTPREFENHLTKAGIASADIHRLTSLFEDVRYGSTPADTTMEDTARQCLQAILRTYGT